MPMLRRRLLALLMPLALCLGMAALGFGHRAFARVPDRAFADAAAVLGIAKADLCGPAHDTGDAIAAACDACRLVTATVLPPRGPAAARPVSVGRADWSWRVAGLQPFVATDPGDPARAPPRA